MTITIGIVKVTEDAYVPSFVKIRAIISNRLFTAEWDTKDYLSLIRDPKVEMVSETTILRSVELRMARFLQKPYSHRQCD